MTISSPGIGSNLDINGIISKLMSIEQRPLTLLSYKESSYQSKISAYGSLSGALSSFQSALSGLSLPSTFQGITATPGDATVLSAAATSKAVAGSYNVNVSQLAQAQTIASAGKASTTTAIGDGTSTAITFQFGSVGGGNFISAGNNLNSNAATNGISANSLSLNGTTIVTSSSTTSANALAVQINLLTSTTGVTATAQATDTGALGAFTTTSGAATYTLDVGGVNIVTNAAIGTTAADIDVAVSAANVALTAAGIGFSGTAAAGTLKFTKADGTNINVQESGVGAVGGLTTTVGAATTKAFTSSVSLSSGNLITVGGSNPSITGFSAGIAPNTFSGATFTQDSEQSTGTVTIDSTNNTLQGIRDAINDAGLGVTASIISDGSATPNHLVLTSNSTGATSTMKITVASGNADLTDLLAYDPAGTQNLTQNSAAQNTALTVNGIAISSANLSVSEAIQGTTLTLNKVGATTIAVARNTASVETAINSFAKAFNSLQTTMASLTSYDATTKQAGLLLGDATTRQIQSRITSMISSSMTGLSGSFTNLTEIGVGFAKDGTLTVDSTKLKAAITDNFADIASLFSAMGTTSDSLVRYVGASTATTPGTYDVNLTALATQGNAVGSAAAGLTITEGVNDSLDFTINGVSDTVTLLPGTYTAATLAAQIQSSINGSSDLSTAGSAVSVSADGTGTLTITSNQYGSTSNVSMSGNGAINILGAAPASTVGVNVAGSINGNSATGVGQLLTGGTGTTTAGLMLEITGGALGARGTVIYSEGYASQLSELVGNYVGATGYIKSNTDGIKKSITDIGEQQAAISARLVTMEARYRAQFTALDILISSMNTTSSFLSQQLSQISSMNYTGN